MAYNSEPKSIIIDNNDYFALVREELAAGNKAVFTVKGYSMTPFLRHEVDSVELVAVESSNIKPLSIVLFTYKGRYILHRILKIDGRKIIIQGDGNIKVQEVVTREDIHGVVTSLLRKRRDGSYSRVECSSKWFILMSRVWLLLTPLRRWILAIYRRVPLLHI